MANPELSKRCPRCRSKDTGSKYVRFSNYTGKRVFCNECGLTLTNKSVDYLLWRWNRPKELQAEYIIPLVNRDPDNLAFCGMDLIEVWGGEQNLCDYISKMSGRKIICNPSYINPEGVLLKGV